MATFFAISDSDGAGETRIAADQEGRIYLYRAATELWHPSQDLEEQLRRQDRDGAVADVPALIVPTVLAGLRATHRRAPGDPAGELSLSRPQPDTRTSAELGVLTQTSSDASPPEVFTHLPDEELVTLAAQTCGDSLDGWDMELSMLVLAEVERRSLVAMVIAHRAERMHRSDPHISRGRAAAEAAHRFARWRNEFYRWADDPHPRESFRRAAEIALLAENTVHDWPMVGSDRRSEIVDEVLDEARSTDTGELDIASAEQLLRTRVEEYLSGPEYAAFLAEMEEIRQRNDAERESDDGSA